jgi:hypothetical protein
MWELRVARFADGNNTGVFGLSQAQLLQRSEMENATTQATILHT